MITADARSRITPSDLDLLASCLGSPSRAVSLDAVLDRRELASFLLGTGMPGPSPSLLFYVLVRHSLLDVGVEDPTVADYFAAMLREFGYRGRANRVDDVDDHDHRYLVDILADLSASTGARQFKVSVYISATTPSGWPASSRSGWRPSSIRRGGPDLSYYENMGGRGYAEAPPNISSPSESASTMCSGPRPTGSTMSGWHSTG